MKKWGNFHLGTPLFPAGPPLDERSLRVVLVLEGQVGPHEDLLRSAFWAHASVLAAHDIYRTCREKGTQIAAEREVTG